MISASVPSLHHCRRSTISFWKYPRCAIGPPNELHPSPRKTDNTSEIDPRLGSDRRGALVFVSGTFPIRGDTWLHIIKQRHEAEIHMQLLMTVKQGQAGIVGDEIYLGFLISAQHYDIFDHP